MLVNWIVEGKVNSHILIRIDLKSVHSWLSSMIAMIELAQIDKIAKYNDAVAHADADRAILWLLFDGGHKILLCQWNCKFD